MTTTTTDVKTIASEIAKEYREHPTHWTQGHWARNELGGYTDYNSETAVCWCLRGAIDKRLSCGSSAASELYSLFELAVSGVRMSDDGHLEFVDWNDEPGRTVQEVIALCEKVAAS